MKRILNYLFIVHLLMFVQIANAESVVEIYGDLDEINLVPFMEYLEDNKSSLTIEEIISPVYESRFESLAGRNSNFGYIHSAIWVRLTLKSHLQERTTPVVLFLDYPNIQYVDFYQVSATGRVVKTIQTGVLRPVETRDQPDEKFVFMISIPPGDQQTVYVRFQSEAAMIMTMALKSMNTYMNDRHTDTLLNGIFIGILLLGAGYFAFLYFQIKDKSHLYLSLAAASLLAFFISFNGIALMHIWPNHIRWNTMSILVTNALLIMVFTKFTCEFLELKKFFRLWNIIFHSIIYLTAGILVVIPFLPYFAAIQSLSMLLVMVFLLILPVGYFVLRKGYKPARFFLFGLLFVAVTAVYRILIMTGLVPPSSIGQHAYEIAAIMLAWFFSQALAERIGLFRAEKDEALEELRRSEERLSMVVKGAELGTWDWDLSSGTIQYNDLWVEMIGYSVDELKPHADLWETFIHPDDKGYVKGELQKHLDGNSPIYQVEYRMKHKSGKWIWILDQGRVVERDSHGKPLRVSGTHLDITESKQAEQTSKINERRYRTLFETAGDAIFIMKDDLFVDCNDQTLIMFGCSKEQILNKPPYFFSPKLQPDGRDSRSKAVEKIKAAFEGKSQFFEWKHIRYDGTPFDAEVSLNLVEFPDGKFIQAIVRDISTRKRSEELIKILNEAALVMQKALTTDELFDKVAEKLKEYGLRLTYLDYDQENKLIIPRYLSFSGETVRKMEKIARKKMEDVTFRIENGTDLADIIERREIRLVDDVPGFLRMVLPKSIRKLAGSFAEVMKIRSFIIAPILAEDQVKGLLAMRSKELQESDKPVIYVFTHQLASALNRAKFFEQAQKELETRLQAEEALRQNEARLQSVFKVAQVGIGIFQDGKLVWFNEKLLEMMHYTAQELGDQKSEILFASPEEYRKTWSLIVGAISEKGAAEFEMDLKRKDDNIIRVILSAAPIEAQDPASGIMFTVLDVTDRRNLEEQFQQSQKMEAVGQLAGGVAHDFNNLLTVISGYSSLLLMREASKTDTRDKLEQIMKASERAEALTRQLLAFSRKQIVKPVILEINKVIKDSLKMLYRLIGEDIRVDLKLCKICPSILADSHQIEQILMNLMVNARDAIQAKNDPEGSRKITIETSMVRLNVPYEGTDLEMVKGPAVMLAISDTGIGMDKATQEKIFEPFYTTKGQGKGTGLGLSTVYGIVKQNKGAVHVYSEPGKGTSFKIYWPVTKIEDDISGVKVKSTELLGGNEAILLVEDDDAVRDFARETLSSMGYLIYSAGNAEEALKRVENDDIAPDLLVTDMVMPGINGKVLSDKIRHIYPAIKVIFTSGYTDNHIVHEGVLNDGVDFIQKPYSLEILTAKIREVLDRTK